MLTALASAADRRKINATLAAAGIDRDLFKEILSGEDVVNKKPSPDIYIMAGQKLNLAPSDCVVIEDAVNGVKAAKAAGMFAIGVTTSFSAEVLTAAGADFIIKDISCLLRFLTG
jgi:HAD superfamily hydrolase (TIGR01509 family)